MTSRKWARLRNRRKRNPTPPSKPACANTAPNATNCASTTPRNWPARPANATCYSTSWPTTTPKNAPSTSAEITRIHHRRIPTRHPIPLHRSHLPQRYTHVLLDEYQDTSTTQAALLTALFHADSTHRSAVNAVGDPFQSTYHGEEPAQAHSARRNKHQLRPRCHRQALHVTLTRRNSRMVLKRPTI